MGLLSKMDKESGYVPTPVKAVNNTKKSGLLAAMDEGTIAPASPIKSTTITTSKKTYPLVSAPLLDGKTPKPNNTANGVGFGVAPGKIPLTGAKYKQLSPVVPTYNPDTTLAMAPINTNPETQNTAQYVAGRGAYGAINTTKGVVNEAGYVMQGSNKGVYTPAAMTNTADNGVGFGYSPTKPESFLEKWGRYTAGSTDTNLPTATLNTNPEVDKPKLENTVNWGGGYKKQLDEFAVEKGYDKDKTLQTIANVAEGVGGMVPSIVSNFIVPGSGLYVMATGAAGNATEEALKGGADNGAALAYGVAVGLTEAATEKIFDGLGGIFGKGAADDVLKSLVKKFAKDETTQKAIMALANTLGEGFEEWLTEYAEAYENKLLVNQDKRSFGKISKDALYSGAIGSLTSLVMQGANISQLSGKDAGEQAADDTTTQISSDNVNYTAQTGENNVQSVPNNMQNQGQNVQKTVDNQTDNATPIVPNVQNNLVPNLPTMSQQAVQAPVSDIKPQVATDTAKAVEVDTAEQVKPEAIANEQYWTGSVDNGYEYSFPTSDRNPSNYPYENVTINANGNVFHVFYNSLSSAKKAADNHNLMLGDTMITVDLSNPNELGKAIQEVRSRTIGINSESENRLAGGSNEAAQARAYMSDLEKQREMSMKSSPSFPENSLGAKITKGMPQGTGAVEAGFDKLGALVNKYGAIPEGENPHSAERVTEERIPKQTADDDKVSQTARTAYEAPLTTNETAEHIEEAVLEKLFSYKKATDRAALEEADKIIADKEVENAFSDWQEDIRAGKVTKTLSALGWKLYNEAAKAGNGKRAVEILVDITNMTRNAAQTTQAASLLKKMSPEYQLYAVQRSVRRMNDQIAEVNEKRNNKISGEERRKAKTAAEDMSKAVKEESAKAVNDVVDELAQSAKKQGKKSDGKKKTNLNPLAEKTDAEKAAEKLANKVDSTTKERKAPEVNAINDMVNELFKSAKESPLPEQAKLAKRSPIEFLTQAIKNKAEYADVWGKSKDILLEKYADNPEVLDMLNDYFEKGIVPTYSDATLSSGVKQVLKDLGIKLSQIKELSWDNRQRITKAITNYLVEQTGAADGDAKMLKRDVTDKITKMIVDSAPNLTRKQKLEIKQATQDAMRKHGVPVESWADETGRLLAEGVSKTLEPQNSPKDKAITQIITDDIKKFVGTIPKPIKTVVSRNAIDTYTDFMENRQYYTEAWAKLQADLKAKYANNPEALKAIDTIINRTADTAATDYYNKQLDGMINKALKSINVKLSELVTQGNAGKQSILKSVTDILINESGIDSETAKTVSQNIADRFNEMLTERSAKRLSAMFPAKVKDVAEKQSLENKLESLINVGAFDSESFNSIAAERVLGIKEVTINPKLADAFVQAKTEAERAEALDDIYHDVADQVPATFADKFDAWRYTAMLFNPVTHIKNILGNYSFAGERSFKNIMSASVQTGANAIAHKVGGKGFEQTRAMALTKADMPLITDADADYTKFVDEIYKIGKFDDAKSKINDYRTIFGRGGKTVVGNAVSKTVGVAVEKVRTTNSTVLDVEDMWVSRPAYVKALAGYLKANGVNFQTADSALLDRARGFAIDEAQKAAYRDHNAFSDWVATAGRGKAKNIVVKGIQIESEGILPFRRTLANMFVRAGEYSPVGLAKTLTYDSYRLANGEITAPEYIDNLAEGLTGTALFALGAFLRAQGIIYYGASGDDKEDKLHETQGMQHFCLCVGGKTYTIDWLAPLIVPIFMGANFYDFRSNIKSDGFQFDDVLKLMSNITTPMLELSMMSSLNDFLDGFSSAKQQDQNLIYYGLVQGGMSYLGQAVPTIFGRVARTIDPVRRTSFTDPTNGVSDDIEYFAQTQLGKIPGLASTKQPYVDQWGRTQVSNSLVGRLAQNFLSPGYLKDVNVSAMETEIERLYQSYGKENEVNVLPPVSVKKYFSNNGESVYMTADEYTQYKKTSGQTAYSELTKLTSSAEYKAMTDAEKAKAVSEVYSQSAEKAKTSIMEARGEMRLPSSDDGEKLQTYIDAGIPEKQAYSVYKAISELKPETGSSRVTIYQKTQVINKQGLTPKQQAAVVGTLYTSHDKETGAVTDESLLPYISNSARLLALYATSKGENTAMINMTIPKSFEKNGDTYELTDAEKKLYKDTYIKDFNAHITSVSTEANVKYWSDNAADKAKNAIIKGR